MKNIGLVMVKGMTEQHSMSLWIMSLCVSEVFFQRGCWIMQKKM